MLTFIHFKKQIISIPLWRVNNKRYYKVVTRMQFRQIITNHTDPFHANYYVQQSYIN